MSVGTQMQQVIAGIQSAAATLKTFSLETDDQQAKNDFKQISEQLDSSLEILKGRLEYIQEQEPQYKS